MKITAISLFAATILSFSSMAVFCQNQNDIVGLWLTQDKDGKIQIIQNPDGKTYSGKIVWLQNPNGDDGKPVKDDNGNPVLNLVNLKNFIFEDGEWIDGTVYDPKSGSTYYCTLTLESSDKLKVRGSVDPMGWIGKTNYWTRLK